MDELARKFRDYHAVVFKKNKSCKFPLQPIGSSGLVFWKARPDTARSQDMRPRPRPLSKLTCFVLKTALMGCSCLWRTSCSGWVVPVTRMKIIQRDKHWHGISHHTTNSRCARISNQRVSRARGGKASQTGAARLDQATMSESCVNQAKVAGSGNRASSKVVHRQCVARGLWGSKAAIWK